MAACGSKQPVTTIASTEPAAPGSESSYSEPASPFEPRTWIAELDDPDRAERAVTQLEQLGDPSAIGPLGEAWLANGRPPRVLMVIISLARPLTAEEAKATYLVDYEETGRPASWDKALPYLRRALSEVDVDNPRSVDSATRAAQALGEAKLGLDELLALATMPAEKRTVGAQIEAVRSIARFLQDARAADGLVELIRQEPPAHPRVAPSREAEERFALYLAKTGAAINALGEMRASKAALPLVLVMYRVPELFAQVRRALVATGAKAEVRKALRGESAEANELFRSQKLDVYCGDRGDKTCLPVSAREYYASIVLGDFYDETTARDLLDVIKRPALPAYYVEGQPSPTTQYHAAFDALRKLGAPEAAEPLRAMWTGAARLPVAVRSLAIAAYPFVARDGAGIAELAAIAADKSADDSLRMEAATALSRLSADTKHIAVLERLATRYLAESAKKRKALAREAKKKALVDAALDKAQQTRDRAKAKLRSTTIAAGTSERDIELATQEATRAEDALRTAKQKHREQTQPYQALDAAAKAYLAHARALQAQIARIEIAVRCKRDAVCFATSLQTTDDEAVANNRRYIKDIDSWTREEKRDLVAAAIDRAMLEIGKLGVAASAHTDVLLDAAVSDDPQVRASILLALPKIAKRPCHGCVLKLDYAHKAGEGKPALGALSFETQMVRSFFANAP